MSGPPYRHLDTLPDLTAEDLREPVRALLADPTARVRAFTGEPVGYESWSRASDGLYVVRGTASSDGGDRAWEVVLKQARYRRWQPGRRDLARQIDDGGDGPADWAYWRREALALASPLLDAADGGGFAAVRCLGVVPLPGERLRLWLERVEGTPGDAWTARANCSTRPSVSVASTPAHCGNSPRTGRGGAGRSWNRPRCTPGSR